MIKKLTRLWTVLKIAVKRRHQLVSEVEKIRLVNQNLRAQMMQVRVWQTSESSRLGFMVSAFVPMETVFRMERNEDIRTAFVERVAKILVASAIDGLVHVTRQGQVTALVFEPPTFGANRSPISPVFETSEDSYTMARKTIAEARKDEQTKRKQLCQSHS